LYLLKADTNKVGGRKAKFSDQVQRLGCWGFGAAEVKRV